MSVTLKDYIRVAQLEQRLRGRYYRLSAKQTSFSAKDMVRGRNPEGFTEAEVLALAERVLLDVYKNAERRHHLRLGR